MSEYWESRFSSEGAMWKFEPADSAFMALEIFNSRNIKKILIPGIGYGRNAKLFRDNGFEITGIEISEFAIKLAKSQGLDFKIHHGSVTSMPFDNEYFDGVFCYALIHLLNRTEREAFLQSCYNHLNPGGLMIFTVASKEMSMYGTGKLLSHNRYMISRGLKVFFYDSESVIKEFSNFGMTEFKDILEPVKFETDMEPTKLIFIVCKKKNEN